jgi:hypothetical protein
MITTLSAMGIEGEIEDWEAELTLEADATYTMRWVNRKRAESTCVFKGITLRHLPRVCAGMVGDVRQICGATRL